MPWVIAIMVALTVLAAGGGLALANLADRARGELAGSATVQIVDPDPQSRSQQADAAATLLVQDPAVAGLAIVVSLVGVMALSREGLGFETPDGRPVHCLVLLGTAPEERARHLQVLAALARTIGTDRLQSTS